MVILYGVKELKSGDVVTIFLDSPAHLIEAILIGKGHMRRAGEQFKQNLIL